MGISMPDPDARAAATEPKRKPTRRDPEKRRLQNMQAQRKYREKMKQRIDRLDQLESLVASVAPPRPSTVPLQGTNVPLQTSAIPLQMPLQTSTRPAHTIANSVPSQRISTTDGPGQLGPDEDTVSSDSSTLDLLSWTPPSSHPSPSWDLMGYLDSAEIIGMEPEMLKPQWQMDYVDSGSMKISSPAPDPASMQVGMRCPQHMSLNPTALAADPIVNHIAFHELSIWGALKSICNHIGITEAMFMDPDAVSPFYRAGAPPSGGKACQDFVKGVQGIFKTIKPDLRPIEEQILLQHHPGIDLLPFPTFRKNILATDAAGIDSEEGCEDMQTGLICWGSGGVSKADRLQSPGRVSSGTPWDGRSWEAKPWFIRKYWDLLGGEDGELVIQSEWWRRSRGDESDIWEISRLD